MKPRTNKLTYLRIAYALYIVVLLLLPEVFARIQARFLSQSGSVPSFKNISQGYPLQAQLIRDWNALRFEYRDYYLYSPQAATSETVNFTTYFGSRAVPANASIPAPREIIWAFGGSTLQNLEADDSLTLANQIVKELHRQHIAARLYNFGVGAFQSSLEVTKFQDLLRQVSEGERPTKVMFYDGFNESLFAYLYGAGRFQYDSESKLRDTIERRYERLIVHSLSGWLGRYSVFWATYIRPLIEGILYPAPAPDTSTANLNMAVQIYLSNINIARGICTQFKIECHFFLQPLIFTKSPQAPLEQRVLASLDPSAVRFGAAFYSRVRQELGGMPGFHDVSGVLDGVPEAHFFDYGHTSPYSGEIIGKAIASMLAK